MYNKLKTRLTSADFGIRQSMRRCSLGVRHGSRLGTIMLARKNEGKDTTIRSAGSMKRLRTPIFFIEIPQARRPAASSQRQQQQPNEANERQEAESSTRVG